jgi:putative ABC transport system permease protein
MNIFSITRLAFTRIFATKMRSFLTMLGVIIGVSSIVALTSIVSGATSGITESIASLGAQQVTVSASSATALTEADATAIESLDTVDVVSTTVSGQGTAVHGTTSSALGITGVSANYVTTAAPELAIGSFLTTFPGSEVTRTVVLSAKGANDLGITDSDVPSEIMLDGHPFELVGVLDDAGGFGSRGTAYVSLESARGLFAQSPYVSSITVQAASTDDVSSVEAAADSLLRSRYGLGADDDAQFSTSNQSSLISTLDSVVGTLSLLLGGIASISLVVGGIGIMNIMLVSVRERTREIGVRRAIGAKQRQILAQFLIEAIVLSIVGGLVGLAIGLGVSALIAAIAGWAFTISGSTVALALGFSAIVGVVFGVWPARTAARLQPVDALRFE